MIPVSFPLPYQDIPEKSKKMHEHFRCDTSLYFPGAVGGGGGEFFKKIKLEEFFAKYFKLEVSQQKQVACLLLHYPVSCIDCVLSLTT